MLARFDDFLNAVTMYRLMLYCLSWLVGMAIVLSFVGVLPYSPWALIGSVSVLSIIGFTVTLLLERAYKLPHNIESPIITTLILFFVLSVPSSINEYVGLGIGIVAALASKYAINWRGAHMFNPAAFGALVASLTGLVSAAWWIATPVLLPFVAIIGLLILRKTRQFSLFFAFGLAAVVMLFVHGVAPLTVLLSYPLVFLGVIMLTEPATMPSGLKLKLIYGAIVGVIFGSQLNFGFISSAPHVALLIGNLFAFFVAVRAGQLLSLVERRQLSPTTYEFAFASSSKINYKAGQYFAWTLDKVRFDSRGNRRSFTIASSPQEKYLKLGVKFYELSAPSHLNRRQDGPRAVVQGVSDNSKGVSRRYVSGVDESSGAGDRDSDPTRQVRRGTNSQFKQRLLALKKGEGIHVSALSGEFVLPKDKAKKLLFIAGGIGVTPFRSMIKDLTLAKQKRDIALFYFANSEQEVLYKDIWQEAKQYGVKIIPFTDREKLDDGLLQKHVPDFKQRDFYLSGPPFMVRAYAKTLRNLNIPGRNIHTDYFSGY